MDKKTEALKLALNKVQEFKSRWCKVPPFADRVNKATREAITLAQVPIFELEHALREALAEQPAQQEPVAWTLLLVGEHHGIIGKAGDAFASAPEHYRRVDVYTTPPQRTWVGLTDVEWMNIVNKDQAWFGQRPDEVAHEVAKLVEAKLKEKNT